VILLSSSDANQNPANKVLPVRRYRTLGEYSAATKQDAHSILVDYDIFENVPMLNAKDFSAIRKLYDAKDLDFRLKPGSAAIDKGVVIPNVTDGFTGKAPDMGALETGKPVPALWSSLLTVRCTAARDGSLLSEGAVIIQYLADLNPQSMPPAGTLARYRLHLPKIPRNQALLFYKVRFS